MASYYIAKDGNQTGPFEEAEILRRIEEGVLSSNDRCWREGMADWRPIATVLCVVPQKPSPPPVPATPIDAVAQATPLFLHHCCPAVRLVESSTCGIPVSVSGTNTLRNSMKMALP
jgi:hypothetical protein